MTKFLLRAPKMGFCQQIKAVAKWKPQHQPSAREPESERERERNEMRWQKTAAPFNGNICAK